MPTTLPSSPSMTMQPMPCCSSSLAISSKDVSAEAVKTPLPFILRIAATCMLVSSSRRTYVLVACDILSLSGGRCKRGRFEKFEMIRKSFGGGGSGLLRNRLFAAGVDEAEAEKPKQKAADMSLPGDIALGAGD